MELPNDIATCHRIILERASALEGIKPQLEGYIHQIVGYIHQIEVQRGQIDQLELRVKELEFQRDQNSRNSSRPPSTDWKKSKSAFPVGVTSATQYGPRLQTMSVLMNNVYCLPRNKVQQIFKDLYGVTLNESTLQSQQQLAYQVLAEDEAYIKFRLSQDTVVYFDETGFYLGKERYREHVASNERYNIPKQQQAQILSKYTQILRQADKEEPPPSQKPREKPKKTKGRNLLDRLRKHQDAVLTFAFQATVPFTNNQAERDIRPTKTKMKVSGCFRTSNGAKIYARVQSFVATVRKLQFNPFNELYTVLTGGIPAPLSRRLTSYLKA